MKERFINNSDDVLQGVDSETGELITINPGDRVVRASSVEFLKTEEKKYKWKEGETFVKAFPGSIAKLAPRLSGVEVHLLFSVVPFVSYSGLLTRGGLDDERLPLRIVDITEMTGYSRRTVARGLETLVSKGVLSKTRSEKKICYFVNPHLFFKGMNIEQSLLDQFVGKDFSY